MIIFGSYRKSQITNGLLDRRKKRWSSKSNKKRKIVCSLGERKVQREVFLFGVGGGKQEERYMTEKTLNIFEDSGLKITKKSK